MKTQKEPRFGPASQDEQMEPDFYSNSCVKKVTEGDKGSEDGE